MRALAKIIVFFFSFKLLMNLIRCTAIAANVQGIGEEADLTAQKMIEAQMFNQSIQRHSSTSAAFLPMPCYMPLRFNSRNF